jgi:hypothetical protein
MEGIHLGNYFVNKYNGMLRDVKIKRAEYVSKNCDLQQEFMFEGFSTEECEEMLQFACIS